MKKVAVGNLGAEEVHRTGAQVLTRARTRAEAEVLFSGLNAAKAKEQRKINGLFIQAQGAETEAPILAKTAAVTKFFEKLAHSQEQAKLSEAQRRYPELLKVANRTQPAPNLSPRKVSPTKGATARVSTLAGGSA